MDVDYQIYTYPQLYVVDYVHFCNSWLFMVILTQEAVGIESCGYSVCLCFSALQVSP